MRRSAFSVHRWPSALAVVPIVVSTIARQDLPPRRNSFQPRRKFPRIQKCSIEFLHYIREEQQTAVIELSSAKDSDLLARFIDDRDGEAFAELVRRHGPMVLAACRRILRHREDAEDAFQATFFVLAMRAGAIRRPEVLPGWLFEVARRTAMRARSVRRRHDELAKGLSAMARMKSTVRRGTSELSSILDAEIARLSPKYRDPTVLCYLEGKTNAEAGRQLSLPAGTIFTRLRRAREILRDRLMARGVKLSGQTLDSILRAKEASEDVPTELAALTATGASLIPSGKLTVAGRGVASHRAFGLAKGVVKSMMTAKLALVAVLLLAVSLSAGVASRVVRNALAADATIGITPASDLISVNVVDRQGNRGLPGVSLCVVADGQEQTIKCDEQGRCTIRRPAPSVVSLVVLSTSPGYTPQVMTWSRKNQSQVGMPATVIVPMRRGVVRARILLKCGRWVHVIDPSVPTTSNQPVRTVEIDLDAAGRPLKKS
jgi:RNA polymerase sigma factor (sigma-70 family)